MQVEHSNMSIVFRTSCPTVQHCLRGLAQISPTVLTGDRKRRHCAEGLVPGLRHRRRAVIVVLLQRAASPASAQPAAPAQPVSATPDRPSTRALRAGAHAI